MTTQILTGMTGRTYEYTVYGFGVNWSDVPGNYAFASYTGSLITGPNVCRVRYIGQTNSFKTRMPSHEVLAEAIRKWGVTHILARTNRIEVSRLAEERDLIASYSPPLNTQHVPQVRLADLCSPDGRGR